jgi:hypothetical protein
VHSFTCITEVFKAVPRGGLTAQKLQKPPLNWSTLALASPGYKQAQNFSSIEARFQASKAPHHCTLVYSRDETQTCAVLSLLMVLVLFVFFGAERPEREKLRWLLNSSHTLLCLESLAVPNPSTQNDSGANKPVGVSLVSLTWN